MPSWDEKWHYQLSPSIQWTFITIFHWFMISFKKKDDCFVTEQKLMKTYHCVLLLVWNSMTIVTTSPAKKQKWLMLMLLYLIRALRFCVQQQLRRSLNPNRSSVSAPFFRQRWWFIGPSFLKRISMFQSMKWL